jgi:hypothetical protein
MIVSSTKGRVRLRDQSFKNPALPLEKLRALSGVTSVDHNERTGSVLVIYNPEELDFDKCQEVLSELDPDALKSIMDGKELSVELIPGTSDKDPDKTLNETVGLIIAMVSVLASGFLRQKKFHVMAGMFLVEMLVEHVWRFRHRLKGSLNIFSMIGLKRKWKTSKNVNLDDRGKAVITVIDAKEVEKKDREDEQS